MLYVLVLIQTLIIAGISFMYGISVREQTPTNEMLKKMPPPPPNAMPIEYNPSTKKFS